MPPKKIARRGISTWRDKTRMKESYILRLKNRYKKGEGFYLAKDGKWAADLVNIYISIWD